MLAVHGRPAQPAAARPRARGPYGSPAAHRRHRSRHLAHPALRCRAPGVAVPGGGVSRSALQRLADHLLVVSVRRRGIPRRPFRRDHSGDHARRGGTAHRAPVEGTFPAAGRTARGGRPAAPELAVPAPREPSPGAPDRGSPLPWREPRCATWRRVRPSRASSPTPPPIWRARSCRRNWHTASCTTPCC